MLSRAKRARIAGEWASRFALLLLLAMLAEREFRQRNERVVDAVTTTGLADALVQWTRIAPSAVSVSLERSLTLSERAWLAAIQRAGTPIHWSEEGASRVVTAAEAVRAPGGWVRLDVAAPERASVILSDASGDLDTLVSHGGGASVRVPALWGIARATEGPWSASTPVPRADSLRRVLVLGGVSWEGKFVIAALEETGWQVDAALALRPGADVSQGLNARPDTARHAAVIVLDSVSDAAAARVAAYVRMGGGLVLAPAAWQAPAFRPLLAGRPGRIIASRPGLVEATPATLRVQTLTPVAHAVALASRGAEVVAAARRVGSGRVVQIGYDESWRWRMTGPDGSARAHREWWSGLISAVAFAPVTARAFEQSDEAPFARLTAALGPPSAPPASLRPDDASSGVLMALLFMLLLGEIASRRLRGAR